MAESLHILDTEISPSHSNWFMAEADSKGLSVPMSTWWQESYLIVMYLLSLVWNNTWERRAYVYWDA